MRKITAQKLSNEVADWAHQGLISTDEHARINLRYQNDVTVGGVLLRWLGFFGVFLIGGAVLGFLGMSMGELAQYLAPFVLAGIAFVLWRGGVALATDPAQRYAISGAALVTVGLIVGFSALMAATVLFNNRISSVVIASLMLIAAAMAYGTAYRYALRWPLLLAVLLSFHALGNMHAYAGHGSYFLGIRDERITFVIALVAIAVGVWHERALEKDDDCRVQGFGHVFVITGLLYANVCLWFLSLPRGQLVAVLLFSAACIAQIIVGARLHDGRFTGFGIVFLSINVYTRMFEGFWSSMSKGAFFLIAGALAVAVGIWLERRANSLKAAS